MLGDSCVDLGQGFPNFDPPEFVVKARTMAIYEVLKYVKVVKQSVKSFLKINLSYWYRS